MIILLWSRYLEVSKQLHNTQDVFWTVIMEFNILTATFPGTILSTIIPVSSMSHHSNVTRDSERALSLAGIKTSKNNADSERR